MEKKFTHVRCINDVIENDVLIFKKGEIYPIISFDSRFLVYYVEPEFYEDHLLTDEVAIDPLDKNFKFLKLEGF